MSTAIAPRKDVVDINSDSKICRSTWVVIHLKRVMWCEAAVRQEIVFRWHTLKDILESYIFALGDVGLSDRFYVWKAESIAIPDFNNMWVCHAPNLLQEWIEMVLSHAMWARHAHHWKNNAPYAYITCIMGMPYLNTSERPLDWIGMTWDGYAID